MASLNKFRSRNVLNNSHNHLHGLTLCATIVINMIFEWLPPLCTPDIHFQWLAKVFTPLGIFPILYRLIYTTCLPLWRCKIFLGVKQTRSNTKKLKTWACITIHPPRSILCRATFCSNYRCKALVVCRCKLGTSIHWDFILILQGKTAPAPSSCMGSAGVQQSLSHTTDSQLDWGLGFD